MHNDFGDTKALLMAAAKFDDVTTDKIQAANWFQTSYLPLAQAMFKRAFTTIGKACKFDGQMALYFSDRLTTALALFPKMELKFNKGEISKQICIDLKGILTNDADPLTFLKAVRYNLGHPSGNGNNFRRSNRNNNKNNKRNYNSNGRGRGRGRRKIQYRHYSARRNEKYPPEKCDYCATRSCDNIAHQNHWREKFNKGELN